ncbi:hypothetical protein VSAK1_25330 [Vibrio mediterranei AK1]|nr:hypothetical protein VSAK1_25330 [Vibrio mediterranei AK1]
MPPFYFLFILFDDFDSGYSSAISKHNDGGGIIMILVELVFNFDNFAA